MPVKQHSALGASSATRWFNCPGSINLSRGIKDKESPAAREGSCAHEVAEICLKDGLDAVELVDRPVEGFEDIPVDEGMAVAVQDYLDAVRKDMERSPNAELAVEVKFDLSHIHPGCFGTNDACVYLPEDKELIIYDYKHGQGVAVEVERNNQMMYYATGTLTGDNKRPIAKVTLVVAQPRCPHKDGGIRRWSLSPIELIDWIADMKAACVATEQVDAPLCAGTWCRWCLAAPCKEQQRASNAIAKAEFGSAKEIVLPDPNSFTDEEVSEILKSLPILDMYVKALWKRGRDVLEAGKDLKDWKLVAKRANRKWVSEVQIVSAAKKAGVPSTDLYEPGKILTPAKLEKYLKAKKIKLDGVEKLWEKKSSGTNMVDYSDDREDAVEARSQEFLRADKAQENI